MNGLAAPLIRHNFFGQLDTSRMPPQQAVCKHGRYVIINYSSVAQFCMPNPQVVEGRSQVLYDAFRSRIDKAETGF